MRNQFVCLAVLTALTGCSHQAIVSAARPTNVYSGFDQRVSLPVTYTIDSTSLTKLKKDDTVSGLDCGAHYYPVDATEAFSGSIPPMMEAVFDNFQQSNGSPQSGVVQLLFRIERFDPRLKFNRKFFGRDADATVEVGVSVLGTLDGKRIFGTSVDSQRSESGDAGAFCSGAGQVLGDATRDAIKDVLEKIGERLSNSQQLRVSAAK